MSKPLFTASNANWRGVLQANTRKTLFVMLTFVMIYSSLGLLCDVLLLTNKYPDLRFSHAVYLLVHFYVTPWATISMFGVAIFSIFITIIFHDKLMLLGTDAHEITANNAKTLEEKQLYNVLEEMKVAAGLHFMPKVYIINADYMNAFASGFSEKSAMVAITRGLMTKLNRQELQAVMAHELSHIRHQDIKLTLMIGVLSNLMLMVVDVLFYNYIYGSNRNGDSRNNGILTLVILLRYGLPLITMLLMLYLSRTREFMADSGAVELMRENESLASALLKISNDHQKNEDSYQKVYGETKHEEFRKAAYIFDPSSFDPVKSITNLFSTHPSIKDRLKAIGCQLNVK